MQLVMYGPLDEYLEGNEANMQNNIQAESGNETNIQWKYIKRKINLTKNNECPVSFIKFESECEYCVCATCKYNIDAKTLQKCFMEISKSCPMCRSEWTDFTIYINNLDNESSDDSSD